MYTTGEIQDGMAIPSKKAGRPARDDSIRTVASRLMPGQSVEVSVDRDENIAPLRANIGAQLNRLSKQTGRLFTTRRVAPKSVRIWRVR